MSDQNKTTLEDEAWKLFNDGKWTDALGRFSDLLKLDPASVGGLQGEIGCLRKLRKFEQTQIKLAEALKKHPESNGILAEQVWLNVEQRKYSGAIDALRAILGHSTDQADAAEQFSWLVGLLRIERRYDEAEETLNEALSIPRFIGN
jgi:tetratricopeptide (TPR) repeat protein